MSPDTRAWAWKALVFFGVFFLLLAAQEGCYKKAVKLRGVVVSKHHSPGSSRIGSGTLSSTSRHGIRYRFTTPDGQTKEDHSDVLLQNWSRLHEGDAVDVEYLPATGDSRVAKQTASAPAFLAIAAVLLASGFRLRRTAPRA